MELIHIGLVVRSAENADRFYADLLGLAMTRTSSLPKEIAPALFGLDEGCEIRYYGNENILFEIFVTGWQEEQPRKMSHTCIEVENREDLLKRCREMGFEVREAPRHDYTLIFIGDNDGNLFEVKEKR